MPSFAYSDAANHLGYTLASAAYCSNTSLAAWNCTPCKRSAVAVSDLTVYQSSATDMRGFSAVVTEKKARDNGDDNTHGDNFLLLSWRGTETLENWIENLKVFKTDRGMSCSDCRVHSGFYDSWTSLSGRIVPELRRRSFLWRRPLGFTADLREMDTRSKERLNQART